MQGSIGLNTYLAARASAAPPNLIASHRHTAISEASHSAVNTPMVCPLFQPHVSSPPHPPHIPPPLIFSLEKHPQSLVCLSRALQTTCKLTNRTALCQASPYIPYQQSPSIVHPSPWRGNSASPYGLPGLPPSLAFGQPPELSLDAPATHQSIYGRSNSAGSQPSPMMTVQAIPPSLPPSIFGRAAASPIMTATPMYVQPPSFEAEAPSAAQDEGIVTGDAVFINVSVAPEADEHGCLLASACLGELAPSPSISFSRGPRFTVLDSCHEAPTSPTSPPSPPSPGDERQGWPDSTA